MPSCKAQEHPSLRWLLAQQGARQLRHPYGGRGPCGPTFRLTKGEWASRDGGGKGTWGASLHLRHLPRSQLLTHPN